MSEIRRAAVLGSPISHSLSPVLHRAAYEELDLPWSYEAIEVDSASLASFIDSCDSSWVGLSLTMPLKEAVLPLLDEVSALVEVTRAANTVLFRGSRRRGENTDVEGIRWALTTAGIGIDGLDGASVAVIGAGATARSAVAALGSMGASVIAVAARRPRAVADLVPIAEAVSSRLVPVPWDQAPRALASDLVISTLPGGAADELADGVPERPGALLDVIYAPWPTTLAKTWQQLGGEVVGGLEMLIGQAAAQVRLMTGLDAPVEAMRAAGLAALNV